MMPRRLLTLVVPCICPSQSILFNSPKQWMLWCITRQKRHHMTHNILYIEDNPDNMRLVQRALEGRGYHLLQAMRGLDGIAIAESEQVELILLDINLPDIDGYE